MLKLIRHSCDYCWDVWSKNTCVVQRYDAGHSLHTWRIQSWSNKQVNRVSSSRQKKTLHMHNKTHTHTIIHLHSRSMFHASFFSLSLTHHFITLRLTFTFTSYAFWIDTSFWSYTSINSNFAILTMNMSIDIHIQMCIAPHVLIISTWPCTWTFEISHTSAFAFEIVFVINVSHRRSSFHQTPHVFQV